ncbi:MAG: methyltransferase domain-containing protein [Candidatus Aenigmatarchaeota archaeon]
MEVEEILKERLRLREVYETIADSWTHLRARPLPEVIDFSNSIKRQGLILDVGCSNCRNLIPFLEKDFNCIGIDFSKGMIREAKKFLKRRGFNAFLVVADVFNLPFKERKIDYVIFTRVLHHLPTRKLRIEVLKEIRRILNENGKILITVWRRYFPRFLIDFFSNIFEKKFEFGDTYKKWTYHGKTYKRFYHLYSKKEIEEELISSGFKIKKFYSDNGNFVSICET